MSTWKLRSSACAAFAFLCAMPVFAAETSPKAGSGEVSNTTITSQRMTVRNQENKAIFEGTVVLTKGALVVHSDVMVVFFTSVDQPASSARPETSVNGQSKAPSATAKNTKSDLPIMSNKSVNMIEATGRVKIFKADGQATCRKAVYYGEEDKIVLTGEPVAWQKGTRVTGQKITMYLAEDRSVVEGGSRVMIEPEGGGAH